MVSSRIQLQLALNARTKLTASLNECGYSQAETSAAIAILQPEMLTSDVKLLAHAVRLIEGMRRVERQQMEATMSDSLRGNPGIIEVPVTPCPSCGGQCCHLEDGVFGCTSCFWTEPDVIARVHDTREMPL